MTAIRFGEAEGSSGEAWFEFPRPTDLTPFAYMSFLGVSQNRRRYTCADSLELGGECDTEEERHRRQIGPQQQGENSGQWAIGGAERRAPRHVERQQAGDEQPKRKRDSGSERQPRVPRLPASR